MANNKYKVLIADDEPLNVEMLEAILMDDYEIHKSYKIEKYISEHTDAFFLMAYVLSALMNISRQLQKK